MEQPRDIDSILENYPHEPHYLISLLQDVQSEYNYISPEHMSLICDHVGVPLTRAWSVATFYKSFSLEPRGEHEIKVCLGTTCHLKGGARLVEACERELGVRRGHTTEDLHFTLDTVNCVGTGALAPVVMIDEDYLGGANIRSLKKRLEETSRRSLTASLFLRNYNRLLKILPNQAIRSVSPSANATRGSSPRVCLCRSSKMWLVLWKYFGMSARIRPITRAASTRRLRRHASSPRSASTSPFSARKKKTMPTPSAWLVRRVCSR